MRLLKFYADWCGPCKALAISLKEENIECEDVNIEDDAGATLTAQYNIRSVPTLIKLDDNNNEVGRKVGLINKEELRNFVYESN